MCMMSVPDCVYTLYVQPCHSQRLGWSQRIGTTWRMWPRCWKQSTKTITWWGHICSQCHLQFWLWLSLPLSPFLPPLPSPSLPSLSPPLLTSPLRFSIYLKGAMTFLASTTRFLTLAGQTTLPPPLKDSLGTPYNAQCIPVTPWGCVMLAVYVCTGPAGLGLKADLPLHRFACAGTGVVKLYAWHVHV